MSKDKFEDFDSYAYAVYVSKVINQYKKPFKIEDAVETKIKLHKILSEKFFLFCSSFNIDPYQAINTAIQEFLRNELWNMGITEAGLEERYAGSMIDNNKKLNEINHKVLLLTQLVGTLQETVRELKRGSISATTEVRKGEEQL